VGAPGAQVGRGPRLAVAEAAQQLHLERDREVLIQQHRLRVGRMQHEAVVAHRPAGAARQLLPHEAVLSHEAVVRRRRSVEDVAELPVERRPLVVADLQQPLLHSHSVGRRACGDAHRTVAGRLARLIGAPRVTGREAQVREVITAMLPSWAKPRVDEPGSLVLTLGA